MRRGLILDKNSRRVKEYINKFEKDYEVEDINFNDNELFISDDDLPLDLDKYNPSDKLNEKNEKINEYEEKYYYRLESSETIAGESKTNIRDETFNHELSKSEEKELENHFNMKIIERWDNSEKIKKCMEGGWQMSDEGINNAKAKFRNNLNRDEIRKRKTYERKSDEEIDKLRNKKEEGS